MINNNKTNQPQIPTPKNPVKLHSLSRKIVSQFCLFTLLISAVWGGFCFILMYNIEDEFIEREVRQEAQFLQQRYDQDKSWSAPRVSHMTLYFSKSTLPDDIKQRYIAEPNRKEFSGEDGRHYHLLALPKSEDVYLVAEVSEMLLVRPFTKGILKLMLIAGLILVLLAFVIAWQIGRKTAMPLKQLADLVNGVAPEQIPDKFAQQFPNNEIGILAQTLETAMTRINQSLVREKCFTRDVSHELRTPVSIIKNAVEVYRNQHSTDVSNPVIDRISQASTQMEQTVTTLLTLAREEHTEVDKKHIKILPLIEQSIIDQNHLINNKPIQVEVNDNCNVDVYAQSGMLTVLLDNLIANAFQYTQQGKVIIEMQDKTLIVADTGPGIQQSISGNITEPAVKGSQSTGYGFGLSIVKRLCEHQNWLFTLSSEQGTKISITLK
ncbi:sensor histidine kinase [Colwellia psychrerythraea]|uniref:histidine kinase n=1 Tax=Colwellia psychrerythraea (strain 34H / ATCC BAA-681) TaxID=167879 RepID=Q481N0_COLP3|nr:HAMP domain-containing sensor histidine kinase [Colwellia psychrerythraea]AAZ24396.1 sensor histidine kinase [Colwellia psychrerythraea 34H]